MRLFQSILSVILTMGLITFLFLIAWYIALPLLGILFILWLFGFFKNERVSFKVTPEFKIHQKKQKQSEKNAKIIDVDYTEIP